MDKELKRKGMHMSKLLRHDPDGLEMDKNGWVKVVDILEKLELTNAELAIIVLENNKKRFEYNEDSNLIRARQGHSLKVDVELLEAKDLPRELYHGTGDSTLDIILKEGIKKMNRNHVHLSGDIETANAVGKRKGKPHILEINAAHMRADGVKIYISNNGVYLTDFVDPKYITKEIFI